jgi:hypothetical protein
MRLGESKQKVSPSGERLPIPAPKSGEIIDINFLHESVDDAQDAINGLWEPDGRTFWRSTTQRDREVRKENIGTFYPTVTLRCIDSLLLLAGEAQGWIMKDTARVVHEVYVPAIISRTTDDLRQSTLNVDNDPNVFTLSIFSQTFARLLSYDRLAQPAAAEATKNLRTALGALANHGALDDLQVPALHPFLAYRIKRAISDAAPYTATEMIPQLEGLSNRLEQHCRNAIAKNLAKHEIGALNPSESVALAFCAASLAGARPEGGRIDGGPRQFFSTVLREDYQLVRAALSVCLEAQDAAGCWPLGRVVEEDKDIKDNQRLEITTFEVATAIAEAVAGLLNASNTGKADPLLSDAVTRLLQSVRYAEGSQVRLDGDAKPRIGWCSDHAYGTEIIESWTSATVLEAILHVAKLVQEFNRRSILGTFTTIHPADRDWPQWLHWSPFKASGEVDYRHPVLAYLDKKMVQPILADRRGLPSAQASTVSALLFGPPGTSKTTIAKAVAEGLNWPVVLLNPGVFIERGLEYIETQARSVFDRLIQLSRAVVVFDECDELFRGRAPRPESEQMRGITAFVTASMLPKLQELHDRGRVVFFICTNNFDSLDPAVKRGGRIDHIIGVGPPDKKAREAFVSQAVVKLRETKDWREPDLFDEALVELISATSRFTRPELERALGALISLAQRTWENPKMARLAARSLVKRQRQGLTITSAEYKKFTGQCEKYSHAHTEGL